MQKPKPKDQILHALRKSERTYNFSGFRWKDI